MFFLQSKNQMNSEYEVGIRIQVTISDSDECPNDILLSDLIHARQRALLRAITPNTIRRTPNASNAKYGITKS